MNDAWSPALAHRHAIDSVGRRLLSGTAQRVLAMLIGMWLGLYDPSCKPLRGQHGVGCDHRSNVTPFSVTQLATEVFGRAGGTQIALVHAALEELAHATSEYRVERRGSA